MVYGLNVECEQALRLGPGGGGGGGRVLKRACSQVRLNKCWKNKKRDYRSRADSD